MISLTAFYFLFLLWAAGFLVYFYKAAQQNNYIILFGGVIPGILILTYGIGGIFLTTLPQHDRYSFYRAYFTDFDLVLVLFYSILASNLFFVGFLLSARGKVKPKNISVNWRNQFCFDSRKIYSSAIILLVFDLSVRIVKLTSGSYISWVAAHVHGLPYWKTTLFQIETFILPFLGIFLYVLSRKEKWGKIFLLLLMGLVILEGDRSNFLTFIVPIAFAFLYYNKIKPSVYFVTKISIFFIFFFGFIGPAIQEVRYAVRDDKEIIIANPEKTFDLLFTKYIPENVTVTKLYGDESRRGQSVLKRRLMGWPAFWASINSQIRSGKTFRGMDEAVRTMALCVPSILYPGDKPEIKSGEDNLEFYELYVRTNDPQSTVFLDAFAIGGIYGLVAVSIIFGCLFGFLVRFLINRWRATGIIICFGLVHILIINRDSFGTIFVNFRNSVLTTTLLYTLFLLSRVRVHFFKNKLFELESASS